MKRRNLGSVTGKILLATLGALLLAALAGGTMFVKWDVYHRKHPGMSFVDFLLDPEVKH